MSVSPENPVKARLSGVLMRDVSETEWVISVICENRKKPKKPKCTIQIQI